MGAERKIVQYVSRVVLSKHSVNIQQASEDAGSPWRAEGERTALLALAAEDDDDDDARNTGTGNAALA
ncbi:hypothetical protein EYF80_044206 [Liparis tanakae]|uniref:Uncharacterized protein n=1 Tax=Liparis tanakae TaxID=230148 RepID=A0A4Z2FZ20_9TELE|nr:hypothetical protein EYF80_044206 [Liparis tanakae]